MESESERSLGSGRVGVGMMAFLSESGWNRVQNSGSENCSSALTKPTQKKDPPAIPARVSCFIKRGLDKLVSFFNSSIKDQ